MWNYDQQSGVIYHDAAPVEKGYAGHGDGYNNPDMQDVHDVGPLPRGRYIIGNPRDGGPHGPFVLPLAPDPSNQMFGRSAFLIHGDKKSGPPKSASNGCIILSRPTREKIAASGDRELIVAIGRPAPKATAAGK